MLITTITKRSSEELSDYLLENWVKVRYLHSEIETLERIDILKDLRTGVIDVIVWVNLLREGLDLPEVSRIAILDADKQWFLRSTSALIQIIWRASRNSKWEVSMYVEKFNLKWDEEKDDVWLYMIDKWRSCNDEWLVISQAMKKAISITNYRRKFQKDFNEKHWITPTTVFSSIKEIWIKNKKRDYSVLDIESAEKEIKKLEFEMDVAAANMEYEKAADIRDMIIDIKKGKKKIKKK